ncbi:hypothetical protein [Pseudomonas sp. TH31]|uniref:hypothetical protein n=1 Tax=Pseudomonas sp. TH31 TaxID=2796396 RepID=UPI001913A65D|nr:hypothetical protein [Pseudomonas sp. TH31]MBK5414124.1 hypothetical protein [Pseudomonas sp. TH31]
MDNPKAEQDNRTTDREENLVRAADIHPFYATPWVIGGLGLLLFGQLSGLVMMVAWVAFLPYLLVVGYVISGLTVALYRTFYS